jgi:hypothetical protein
MLEIDTKLSPIDARNDIKTRHASKVDCIMSSDLDVQRKSREPEILDQSNNDIDPSITHALSRELSRMVVEAGFGFACVVEREGRRLDVCLSSDSLSTTKLPSAPSFTNVPLTIPTNTKPFNMSPSKKQKTDNGALWELDEETMNSGAVG